MLKLSQKLGIVFLLCSITILLLTSVSFAKNEKPLNFYVNGEKTETSLKPQIINGRTLLPLRFTCELFDLPVNWDAKTKTIAMTIGDQKIKLTINKKEVEILHVAYLSKTSLDQAPVLIGNTAYIPIRFIAETLNFTVNYDYAKKSVSIQKPFVFKNNQWYVTHLEIEKDPSPVPIENFSSTRYLKRGNNIYFILRIGDLTMGHDVFYLLNDKGQAKQLFYGTNIKEFKIDGDDCYFINAQYSFIATGTLSKINLSNPFQQTVLGDKNFTYGFTIKLNRFPDDNKLYLSSGSWSDEWQIKPDGIYIVAYNGNALLENTVKDLDLLKNSYGYYLVDKNGKGHKLIENLPLEEYVK